MEAHPTLSSSSSSEHNIQLKLMKELDQEEQQEIIHPSSSSSFLSSVNTQEQQNLILESAKPSLVSLFSASSTVCACKSEGVTPPVTVATSVSNSNSQNGQNHSSSCTQESKSLSGMSTTATTVWKTISTPVTFRLNDEFDEIDLFESIADIRDPEHPYSLEELNIVNENSIVFDANNIVKIFFTPTVKHCSLVSHISLCIRERLKKRYGKSTFTTRYKLEIYVTEGSHNEEEQVNKQMNDKERVTAALENPLIMELVRQCIKEE
ncbi:hypothetical protein C9374_002446 [Naegleria lovaniensis]|uniref:MIP18 family-like domain-containing protein n=1 Tax=Naegleria lovaniensis TaxID=51637 RepID=A0AA88GTE4_NAELO|nr:uncharacterized protein C9374_002446 [Naegleria lovaniensis]KAG2386702.1 hypothetical protein C9374_002446 [Naegleria lovaniensis]